MENKRDISVLRRQQLAHIAVFWLESARKRIKESSYIKYGNLLKNHILPELGELCVTELSTERVDRFVRRKLSEGRRDHRGGLAEKTVKDILAVLKEVCSFASQMGWEIPCRFELIRLRRQERQIRILNREEQRALGAFLFRDEELLKTGILLSLYMGLRIGEVCALKREHIRYEEAVLQVRLTMQRIQDPEAPGGKRTKIIVTAPKSSKSLRDIPIPPPLFRRLLTLAEDVPDNAYVLTGRPDRFIEPRTMENVFKRYLRECHMPDINYHALRHTFATRCIENGFDVKTLSEILGHANVNITLNRYVHSSMERKRENMGRLQVLY